ncbi:MAG TPA: polysaccharide deacetylase family protein [Bryobacteraceae bacterium]|nr:polysaccharide deacetylase family protein [Bryobacteraceae bacterium]
MPVARVISKAAFGTLERLHLFDILSRTDWRRSQLVILCYHGVAQWDEHLWRPDLYLSPETFEARLASLKACGANVLPLGEALERLARNALPPRSVVITFDDGFTDFCSKAAPALASYGYPATIYLTTHYTRHRVPVSNLMIDYLLWKAGARSIAVPECGIHRPLEIAGPRSRIEISQRIIRRAESRQLGTCGKNEMLSQIAERLGIDYQQILRSRILQILSGDEVNQLSAAGFGFELHTHRHRTPDSEAVFEEEIRENRRLVFKFTGVDPRHFCYPSGRYSQQLRPWLSRCGIRSATTCEFGVAKLDSDLFQLPRILDHDHWCASKFEGVVAGFPALTRSCS